MGDRRFPQHARGAEATIAGRASPSPLGFVRAKLLASVLGAGFPERPFRALG